MDKIKWGIIGCGDVAEVKSGPAFKLVKNSSLVSVMRRNKEKVIDFAKRHNVPLWTTNPKDILNNVDINAIYIATPPSTHLEYALKALEYNKNVYLEKPMALNSEEAAQICQALKNSKGKLTVAHYRRKLPAFLKVEELLKKEIIGTVTHADITVLQPKSSKIIANSEESWRLNPKISGGGYFYDIAPHQIDLMLHYFGTIEASSGYSKESENNSNVQDTVNGIILFKSGVQFRGIWNFTASELNKKDSCTIYGLNGKIQFSFYGDSVSLESSNGIETFTFPNTKHVQQPMIQATVDYFLKKGENPCSADEGLIVMKTLEKLVGSKS